MTDDPQAPILGAVKFDRDDTAARLILAADGTWSCAEFPYIATTFNLVGPHVERAPWAGIPGAGALIEAARLLGGTVEPGDGGIEGKDGVIY